MGSRVEVEGEDEAGILAHFIDQTPVEFRHAQHAQ